MWKGDRVNKHHVLHECSKKDCMQNMSYCCSFILKSNMLLANGCLLIHPSNLPSPCLGLCETLTWLEWGMPVSAGGALLGRNLPHFELIPPSTLCARHCHHQQTLRGRYLKNLAVPHEFWSTLLLNIGRWLIKNMTLMECILGGFFQTWNCALPASQIVILTWTRQWGKGGQRKAFLKLTLPLRKMLEVHSFSLWSVYSGTV